MIGRRGFVGCLLAAAAAPCLAARAEENFFAGKTITYIVATKPGGGYDTMGRLVAKYLETHIPGSRIVVKNIAGAGHMIGCQTIYNAAPDGLTIGTFNTALIYSQLTGALDSDLDLRKMSWIGKAAIESRVIVVGTRSGITSADELTNKNRTFNVGVTGKGSAAHVDAMLLARIFGYNFKPIFGFEGTDAELSMLRGEIDAQVASRSSLEPFVASGGGRFLLEFGGAPDSTLPQGDALAKNPTDKAVIDFIEAQAKFTRPTAGPPGIPPERLQFLRSAYLAIFSDPGFLAEAKALNLPISPASGEAVAERINIALNPPPEIRAIVEDLLK
jgi:tripartite-type tricarboxylate transporter receptor subunit TctC